MKKAVFSILVLTLIFFSCYKDTLDLSPDLNLRFSIDTLRFDTVFTSLGSATRTFKVYNPSDKTIKLSKVYLEKGTQSLFNINVDGIASRAVTEVEIPGNDSIYIAAEVTINPNLSDNPYIIDENLIFELNGKTSKVVLEAWGQNANYIPNKWAKGQINVYEGNIVWDDKKPYVVYGVIGFQNGSLTIEKGTKVFVHGGLAKDTKKNFYNDGLIVISENASLQVNGTMDAPVTFASDRLEPEFKDESGQWAGIRIATNSLGANFKYTKIKNSIVGVRVDSAATMQMQFCTIANTSSSGVLGVHAASINVENSLIYNCGQNAVQIEYGGNVAITHCTLASVSSDNGALRLGNALCTDPNDPSCGQFIFYRLIANVRNCIIYGNRSDELNFFDRVGNGNFNVSFKNTIVRITKLLDPKGFPNFLVDNPTVLNVKSSEKLFKDASEFNYNLDSLSVATKKGVPIPNFNMDLNGKVRDVLMPDIGCFESKFK
jgi:hypothetical protein